MSGKKKVERFENMGFLEEMQEAGVPCTIRQFANQIKTHYHDPDLRKDALLAIGESGIGKTQIVFQVAEELGIDTIYLNLTASGKEDIIGWPIIKSRYPEMESEDMTGMMKAMLSGEKYYDMDLMELLKPLVNPKTKALVLLDEIAQIGMDVQRAVFPIIQERRIGNIPISDGILIVSTMNPTNKAEYMLDKMQKAMQERFNIYVIKPSIDEWTKYGLKKGFNEDVISYVNKNPSIFSTTNPRRLEKLSKLMNGMDKVSGVKGDVFLSVQSVLGPGKAGDFIKFANQRSKSNISAVGILQDKYTSDKFKKEMDKEGKQFGIKFHSIQSDIFTILGNPTAYPDIFGTEKKKKKGAIEGVANGIVKVCSYLKERSDMDLVIGLLKGITESGDGSIHKELIEELSLKLHTDEELTTMFLTAAGMEEHMGNITETEAESDD